MRGLSKRKGSEVWQGRLYIPTDIWNQRELLLAAGEQLPKNQDWLVSLGERDQRRAETAYSNRLEQHRRQVSAWSDTLRELARIEKEGARALSHEEKAGVVRTAMETFLAQHREQPDKLPPIEGSSSTSAEEIARKAGLLSQEERKKLRAWHTRFKASEDGQRDAILRDLLDAHYRGERWAFLGEIAWRDLLQSPEVAAVVGATRQHSVRLPDTLDSAEFVQRAANAVADVRQALEDYRQFRPEKLREVEARIAALPTFALAEQPSPSRSRPKDLFELLEDKLETENRRPSTGVAYRGSLTRFSKFAGHKDPAKVTKDDVLRWRDSMRNEGIDSATINRKHLAALKAVLEWGVSEGNLPDNPASAVLDRTAKEPHRETKGHTREHVQAILQATFTSGDWKPGLSLPYRRAIFWLPWLLTYTGLRPVELAQLRGQDVRMEKDVPFLFITPEAGGTKGNNAWITGIHDHIMELGFMQMVRSVGTGPLFYSPYPPEVDLRKVKSPRSVEAYSEASDWIRDGLKLTAFRGRQLHAFRHAFTTTSRGGGKGEDAWEKMDKETRDYMLGSRPKTDARESYGDWPPEVVHAEINKLPRLQVKDSEWRP